MKTIVVTGANRGIGFEICKQLGALGHEVIVTARNVRKGIEASNNLRDQGFNTHFYQLDLEEEKSITLFTHELTKSHHQVDVLINNAGILRDNGMHLRDLDMKVFDRMMKINLKGPMLLTRSLLKLLKNSPDPRVINVSSGMGALTTMGGGNPAYRISKTALNALTAIFAAEERGIKFNTMCPGWVKTTMGGSAATRDVEKGAETVVWLSTAENIPQGKFIRDKKVIDW
ncbi:MAG: SDR family NAD(P)-dependent oxidoreductase [Cyclobacteriaceae bacterium]